MAGHLEARRRRGPDESGDSQCRPSILAHGTGEAELQGAFRWVADDLHSVAETGVGVAHDHLHGGGAALIAVTDDGSGTLSDTATVTGVNQTLINTGDDSATETSSVIREVDLVVTKTESSDPVVAGSSLTYTLTAANLGPSDATGLTITDTLPLSTTFSSATAGAQQSKPKPVANARIRHRKRRHFMVRSPYERESCFLHHPQ